jgi:hypothetical protein
VAHVARAAHDRQAREVLAHAVDQREARLHVVDRVHEQARLPRAGRLEQVEPRRVAVVHAEAELAQRIDLVRVVVQHHRAHAARGKQAPDDLPEAPEAGDDHRAVLR